jgi:hypothetical protein
VPSLPGHTRAEVGVEKPELNPIQYYDEAGSGLLRLGSAADQTRADSPDGEFELIPVQRWTMTGVRFH